MWWRIGLVAIAIWHLLLAFAPLRLHLRLQQDGKRGMFQIEIRLLFLRLRRELDLGDKVTMALTHMWKRWRAKGKPGGIDTQESVGRIPVAAALPVLRRLARRVHCTRLRLRVEVGGGDAMESALLAGSFWGLAGLLTGLVSRNVRLHPGATAVAVVPNFQRALLRSEIECILVLRFGQAIIAMIGLLRRREIVAWVRDSLRRKGDQTSDRTPDSGADEDGDGKP